MKKSLYLPGLLVACCLLLSAAAHAAVPTFTTDPANDTVCSGSHTVFFAAATDTSSYIWQVSTDGSTWSTLTDTTFYTGTATDTLHVTASNMLNGFLYRAIATNGSGSDTSTAALLKVDTLDAGVITGASVVDGLGSVCVGSSTLLVDGVGGGVWSHLNHLADTLNNTGTITGLAQGMDTVTYVVTNSCGTAFNQIGFRVDTTVIGLPITGPTTTCVGHTITLANGNVLGTWSWNPTNTHASIDHDGVLTGVSGGNDTVTYAFTNACNSVSSTIVVHVDTPLDPGVISGPNSVCAGSWIPLTETVGDGIWISSSSATAIVDFAGNVTGVSAGTAVISYYQSNGCGASVATDTIHVFREASAITGGDSVGVGGTRALADSATGGTWSISIADSLIATINDSTGVVTGVGAGTTTVTYTVTNICGTSSATETFYVGAAQVSIIAGPSSVCIGAHITLSDTVAGGTWHSYGDSVATIDAVTGTVTGVAAGTDSISYTYTNGFGTATAIKVITVTTPPVISLTGPNIISLGGNYFFRGVPADGTFTASNSVVGMIVATTDSVFAGIHFATFASFVVYGSGRDTIHYRVTNDCGTADSIWIVSLPLGVHNVAGASAELNVYPNPTQGSFTVNLLSPVDESADVVVTNLVGEKVKEFKMQTNKPATVTLDQPEGVYFLSATTSGGKYTSKVTVAK